MEKKIQHKQIPSTNGTYEEVLPSAEEVHFPSRCIDLLAMKTCADPKVFNFLLSRQTNLHNQGSVMVWNGIFVATSVIIGYFKMSHSST